MAKALKPIEGQNRNILSSFYPQIIEAVIECAYRNDGGEDSYGRNENKITVAGFDALYSLFEHAPPDAEPLLLKSLEHFYDRLKETAASDGNGISDRAKDLQSFL